MFNCAVSMSKANLKTHAHGSHESEITQPKYQLIDQFKTNCLKLYARGEPKIKPGITLILYFLLGNQDSNNIQPIT